MWQKLILLLFNMIFSRLPGSGFSWLKRMVLRLSGLTIGKRVFIDYGACVWGSGRIVIESETFIGRNVFLECDSGHLKIGRGCEVNHGSLLSANGGSTLEVGDKTHIAHFVSIKCSTQEIDVHGDGIVGGSVYKDIVVGAGCWLCAGCIVLPGVTVGSRNVVAAGAVVTKSSPPDVLLAGVPAVVKKLYSEEK